METNKYPLEGKYVKHIKNYENLYNQIKFYNNDTDRNFKSTSKRFSR